MARIDEPQGERADLKELDDELTRFKEDAVPQLTTSDIFRRAMENNFSTVHVGQCHNKKGSDVIKLVVSPTHNRA